MHSRTRSVSVATFAGVLWVQAHAWAEPSPEQSNAASGGGAASPVRAPPEAERLSDEAELARVVSLVEAAKYEECDARLSRLLDPKATHPLRQVDVVENARLYHATCLIGLGKTAQADEPLRAAVRKNPQMRAPDSLLFPPRVVERFLRVREELYAELRAADRDTIERARRDAKAKQQRDNDQWARMLLLERLARQEVVIQKNSRFIALLPLGAGQFQNGNPTLGWIFLGSETLLGAAAITSTAIFGSIKLQADRLQAQQQTPAADVPGRLRDWHSALTVTTYAFLGVTALGIIEAQISFVPETRRVRERPLPKLEKRPTALRLMPDLELGPRDVKLGVRGSF